MDKKVLVTGGSGLIGTYLKDIMPSAIYVSSKDFNLLREDEVKKMFKEIQPNIVIHLAALVGGVHHNIEEPVRYFEENIMLWDVAAGLAIVEGAGGTYTLKKTSVDWSYRVFASNECLSSGLVDLFS